MDSSNKTVLNDLGKFLIISKGSTGIANNPMNKLKLQLRNTMASKTLIKRPAQPSTSAGIASDFALEAARNIEDETDEWTDYTRSSFALSEELNTPSIIDRSSVPHASASTQSTGISSCAAEGSRYREWAPDCTRILIDLYREFRNKVGTTQTKTLRQMWILISEKMKEMGYNFSAMNCENRWKVLERNYKKFVDDQNKTGSSRKRFEFEEEMNLVYGEKSNIFPELLLTANETIIPQRPTDTIAKQEEKINEEPAMKKIKLNARTRTPLKQKKDALVEIGNQMKAYQEKKIELSKERHEMKKERFEWKKKYYERRIEIENLKISELKNANLSLSSLSDKFS